MTESRSDRPKPEAPADRAEPARLTEGQVVAYLRAHPDFLAQRPELLDRMEAPSRDHGGGVEDFQQAMIDRLRHEARVMKAAQRTLIETARGNQRTQARVHEAVLRLIEARSFEALIATLTTDMMALLDLDACVLVVESNGQDIPHVHSTGVRVVEPGQIDGWIGDQSVLLIGDIEGDPELFGGAAGLVRSVALLRLEVSQLTPVGLLALGSRNPAMFERGQATELLQFLGKAVERAIRAWLDLPA